MRTVKPDHEFLTVPEVAALLRLEKITVQRMLARGEIPGFKIGRLWRIRRSDVDHYFDRKKESATHGSPAGSARAQRRSATRTS